MYTTACQDVLAIPEQDTKEYKGMQELQNRRWHTLLGGESEMFVGCFNSEIRRVRLRVQPFCNSKLLAGLESVFIRAAFKQPVAWDPSQSEDAESKRQRTLEGHRFQLWTLDVEQARISRKLETWEDYSLPQLTQKVRVFKPLLFCGQAVRLAHVNDEAWILFVDCKWGDHCFKRS